MYMKLNNNLLNIKNTHSTSETDVYSANQTNVEIENAVKDVYSTSEVKTNKTYLGKPVYRKVIEKVGNVSANTWFSLGTISNVDILVNHYNIFNYGISGNYLCRMNGNNFEIYILDNLNLQKTIVEYTKTTD